MPVLPRAPSLLTPVLFLLALAFAVASACTSGTALEPTPSGQPTPTTQAPAEPPATAPAVARGGAPQPRVLLPDLQTLEPGELYIESDPASGARRLRFSTTLLNAGEGPLELIGRHDPADGAIVASQRITRADWTSIERAAGRFLYDGPHSHWHFVDLTVFELWSYNDNGDLDQLLATTGKATFCAIDEIPTLAGASEPAYFSCDAGVQGLSAGWTDTYEAALPGQELDITQVSDGRYAIRTIVDPDDLLLETDDANNATTTFIEISDDNVSVVEAP